MIPKEVQGVGRIPSKEEKSRFLSDWALQHPLATIREARAALHRQFGVTKGTSYISETLRIARQVHEEAQGHQPESDESVAPRTPQGILMLIRTMRALGLRKVEIMPDGSFTYEAHGKA